jgi:hypothetical protein
MDKSVQQGEQQIRIEKKPVEINTTEQQVEQVQGWQLRDAEMLDKLDVKHRTEMLDALTLSFNCLSNIGVGIGEHFGPQGDFTVLTSFQKLILIFDMVMGRLEVLTIILCFLPSFWRV